MTAMLNNGDTICVGDRVCKPKSNKPFKSKNKVDEVLYFGMNPYTGLEAVFLKESQCWVDLKSIELYNQFNMAELP